MTVCQRLAVQLQARRRVGLSMILRCPCGRIVSVQPLVRQCLHRSFLCCLRLRWKAPHSPLRAWLGKRWQPLMMNSPALLARRTSKWPG